MALRTYRQWALDNSPTWLRGPWGEKLINAIGGIFDEAYGATFEAGAAGSVDAPSFPADALALVGSERNIERYPDETDEEYKVRVKGAWESWAQSGTMHLVDELTYLGVTAVIKENFTEDWNWDGDANNWSRIWPVITDHGWSRLHFGDSGLKLGQDHVIGCTATRSEARTLLRLIRKWKPGHTFPITVVVMSGGVPEPDGTWDDPANRSTSALYHYER